MAQSAMAAADFRVHLGSRGHQLVFLCATFGAGVCPIKIQRRHWPDFTRSRCRTRVPLNPFSGDGEFVLQGPKTMATNPLAALKASVRGQLITATTRTHSRPHASGGGTATKRPGESIGLRRRLGSAGHRHGS